jgi:hypothetical protein
MGLNIFLTMYWTTCSIFPVCCPDIALHDAVFIIVYGLFFWLEMG